MNPSEELVDTGDYVLGQLDGMYRLFKVYTVQLKGLKRSTMPDTIEECDGIKWQSNGSAQSPAGTAAVAAGGGGGGGGGDVETL